MEKEIKKEYQEVLDILPDKPSGQFQKSLARRLGLTTRNFRQRIRNMRKSGIPICSNDKDGYWLATTSAEVRNMMNYYEQYIISMTHTRNQLKITYQRLQNEEKRASGNKELV